MISVFRRIFRISKLLSFHRFLFGELYYYDIRIDSLLLNFKKIPSILSFLSILRPENEALARFPLFFYAYFLF